MQAKNMLKLNENDGSELKTELNESVWVMYLSAW